MSILWTVVDEVFPRPWSSPSPLSMIPMPCKAEIYMQEKKSIGILTCCHVLLVCLFLVCKGDKAFVADDMESLDADKEKYS